MAIYNASLLISASNATYFTNVTGGIAAVAVRDFNDTWISSSALLTGSNTFVGNQIISGNVDINGTITASLQTGYLYVGNGSGKTQAVATSSIIANTDTGSLLVTGSVSGNTLTFTKGDASTFNLSVATGSTANINTGSFATTGSNTFNGDQSITGSVSVFLPKSSGKEFRVNWGNASSASMFTEESAGPNQTLNLNSASLYINRGGLFFSSGSFTSQVGDMQFNAFPSASFTIRTQYGGDAILRANTDYTDNNRPHAYFQASPNGQINIVANGDGIAITGSLGARIQGLQYPLTDGTSGQAIITDGSGILSFGNVSINTGSFATTGSNTFTGQQRIYSNSGLVISGSSFGYGITLQGQQGIKLEGSGGPRLEFPNGTWFNGNESDDMQFTGDTDNPLTRGLDFFLYGTGSRNIRFRNNSGNGASILFQTTTGTATDSIRFSSVSGGIQLNAGSGVSITGSSLTMQGFTYPTTDGTSGQVLTTNGSKVLTFTTITGSGGGTIDTGSFLTTGSLAFGGSTNKGNGIYQFNIATGSAGYAIEIFNTGSDALYGGTGSMRFGITDPGNPFIQLKGQPWFQFGTGNQLQFQSFTSSYDNGIIIGPYYTSSAKVHLMPRSSSLQFSQDIGSGEVPIFTLGTHNGVSQSIFEKDLRVKGQFTASLQQGYAWVGNSGGVSSLVATSSFGGGTAFSNPNLVSNSGSLFIIGNTFNSASSNLSHISSSTQTLSNIVFKNTNNTGTTIVSGSGNIFTNPSTPNTGYIRYIGGANNIYLNNTQGAINSQITASATSVSGNRPTMNNNIFQGAAEFVINQAVNGGTHNYNNNLFGSANAVTINALAYTGSSFTFSDNILKAGLVTINPASASLAEIAAGISGSANVEFLRNIVGGLGSVNINVGPKMGTAFNSFIGNIMFGTLNVTNISSSAAVGASSNIGNGTMAYTNAGAAGLALHRNVGSMSSNYGSMNLFANASAIQANNNIANGASIQITNQTWSGSIGSGSLAINRNIFQGQGHTIIATGSQDAGTTSNANMSDNTILGRANAIYLNQTGQGVYNAFNGNVVGGYALAVSGSNSFALGEAGGAYFGRWNADDGRRNKTGENIFFVGTGTSTTRKTGFLIDSGSNTFIEGTLNVSGSTTMTGSLILSSSAAIELQVIGNTEMTGSLLVSSFTTLASVSSSLNFADDTAAAAGGVPLGGLYRNGNFVMIRLT